MRIHSSINWRNAKKLRYCYVLLIPTIAYFIFFHYVPMYGITIAFKDFSIQKGILGSPWAGLKYFNRLFDSTIFYTVLRNTLVISLYRLLLGFPAPIIFALAINEVMNRKLKSIIQTISYLPHFISWVVMAGIIMELLSPTRGIINYLISFLGFEPIVFLSEPRYFRSILVITGIWKEVGWGSIIYLAAIAGIPSEQYESAYIDGASHLRVIRHIILPSILPVVSVMFILQLGNVLNAGFDQVFNLYNSTVYSVGDIIDTYTYRVGLGNDMQYSYSTAVNFFKNFVGFALVVATNLIVRNIGEGENRIW